MQKILNPVQKETCYVVMVNYNGWKDTIECLESVLKSDYKNYKIIVCDNASGNDSWDRMIDWASGGIQASCSDHPKIRSLVYPLLPKPVDFDCQYQDKDKPFILTNAKIHFLKLKKNLGFAGGMNMGIRLALQDKDCGYIWCLNNDTVVESSVMRRMIATIKENMDCGICSSYSRPYDDLYFNELPNIRFYFNKWLANDIAYNGENKNKLFYYDGASFMVCRKFVERVGLMEESYFLYHEEPDWTIRGKRKGYKIVFDPEGLVYHKGGQSTGGKKKAASYLADYYMIRGRILITKKFFPYCLPTVYLSFIGAIIHRIQRKQYNRIWMILKLMINPRPLLKISDKEEKK